MVDFRAYHDATSARHQQRFTELTGQGYRLTSLSIYGAREDPRYAAVWVMRTGPEWIGVHALGAAQYQARFDELASDGFVPVLLTATGPRANPIFAGTFEKRNVEKFLCKVGLTDGPETNFNTLAWANKWARQNECILRCAAVYGNSGSRAYAGVWLPNPNRTKWAVAAPATASEYQIWFDAYASLPFRPAFVDASGDEAYMAVFQDDSVGEWVARHGLSSVTYQEEFDKQTRRGLVPVCVQGGGEEVIHYSAIFAAQVAPIDRVWTVKENPVAALTVFDDIFKDFMVRNSVRAGSFAIVKNGKLKYARGYTWAELAYPDTQADSVFRLASCSKAFACAAIHRLVETDRLQLDANVFALLEIDTPALPQQTVDANSLHITVQQLIEHSGGWDSTLSGDPVFQMRSIAQALGKSERVSKLEIARYMYGRPLDFVPGSRTAYSNFGYLLLGLIVERVSGRAFVDFLKSEVLEPLGIHDVFLAATLRDAKRSNEVSYDDPKLGLSAWSPKSGELVPYCYGGEGWATENMDSGGGLCASAPALARFISHRAVWGIGPRAPGSARSGAMAGVSSRAVSRHDSIDWVYIFNTRTLNSGALEALNSELNSAFAEVPIG